MKQLLAALVVASFAATPAFAQDKKDAKKEEPKKTEAKKEEPKKKAKGGC